jgi:hypothetical protein
VACEWELPPPEAPCQLVTPSRSTAMRILFSSTPAFGHLLLIDQVAE